MGEFCKIQLRSVNRYCGQIEPMLWLMLGLALIGIVLIKPFLAVISCL